MIEILNAINSAKKIAIISHKAPDPDTIGSALALYHALLGTKSLELVCVDDVPINLRFLNGAKNFKKSFSNQADLIVTVDVANKQKLALDLKGLKTICIDHHANNDIKADLFLIDESLASTAEVIYKLLKFGKFSINKPCADALYTALVSDTRFFSKQAVSIDSFAMAQELLALGANKTLINQALHSYSLASMRLFGKALSSFLLLQNGSIIFAEITQQDLEDNLANVQDTEDIADFLLYFVHAQIALFLVQTNDGLKGSLRSKSINLLPIAKKLGGGGHKHYAGFFLKGDYKSQKDFVLRSLDV